ncbi:hypothetical protein lerEdw1_009716 [Lerista edwardsae]|nr:hypothetical protein lerEdw1_009716 [Lerista edwardsae]
MQEARPSCTVPLDHQDACRPPVVLVSHAGELLPAETAVGSLEKRIREEQTWHLRKTLQDSLSRFQDWLGAAEGLAACPNSAQVSYASSKRELQKFEALQRQIAEQLLPLESLNRQYHRLARSGHAGPQLRASVQDVSRRWDALKVRAAAVCKRLKHFVSQREEFELERETIQVWLMELDLRLTDVEHFSRGTALEKMTQLQAGSAECKEASAKRQAAHGALVFWASSCMEGRHLQPCLAWFCGAFQQDVQANAERVDHLLVWGELLIQKSQPEDAEILEEELQELSAFCQEVFRRVFCFRWRLVSIRLVFEDEWLSDRDSDLESDCFTEPSLDVAVEAETSLARPPGGPAWQPSPERACSPRHRQPDPNFGGIVELEWDPSGDVWSPGRSPAPGAGLSSAGSLTLHLCSVAARQASPEGLGRKPPQEGWEHLWLTDEETPLWNSVEKFCGRGPDGYLLHPHNQPLERGTCRHVEPVGFDPRCIETWLGQSCQQKTELQLGKRKRLDLGSAAAAAAAEGSAPPSGVSSRAQKLPRTPALLSRTLLSSFGLLLLLLAAGASLLALPEPSCLRANSYTSSFHLVLKYINGPPPT